MPRGFTFAISLSVLNHLGRNLYRSFATVLGEAISNSWDADANEVQIYIDKKKRSFFIKDDGVGMTATDFQGKFLKIGYSKRHGGRNKSPGNRPFIGRKGIGKLALLSCAERVHVISKTARGKYVGGIIDNSGLDKAIKHDLATSQYRLGAVDVAVFGELTEDHDHGTIIYFEGIKEGIRNSLDSLKKIIALYFRFSLLDPSFDVFVDNDKVTLDDLKELANNTEFLWNINDLDDPYIKQKLKKLKKPAKAVSMKSDIQGFIASAVKPTHLAILGTGERVSVDLFVNGRLRERDILKHIPTARIVESYFYGQIHFNSLDEGEDRFTSSREGVVAEDPVFAAFLEELRKLLQPMMNDWDKWRTGTRQDGDPDNPRITKRRRAAMRLYDAVSGDYEPSAASGNRKKVDDWVDELKADASFNIESYAECFVSENLVRKYLHDKSITISAGGRRLIKKYSDLEVKHKRDGNLNIDLRQSDDELSFLDMTALAQEADVPPETTNTMHYDAKQYKPIRDALAHTALLTDEAKKKLSTVYDNIKGRIKKLLDGPDE